MENALLKRRTGDGEFPHGFHNAYIFAVFNAFSYQIVLSSPMILYAQTLGASATELGIITGMMPLLVIFQIPASQYIQRIGYRRFVFAGRGMRVAFIFAMALIPLTTRFLSTRAQINLLLLLLFGFNLFRGISNAAWLPWISALVPENARGKYLARDSACISIAGCITFLACAFVLGKNPHPWQFSILFIFSGFMGLFSLTFLKRIPDVKTRELPENTQRIPVPWKEIISHKPFKRLLLMVIVWSAVYGGMSAFVVAFMKSEAGMESDKILMITSVSFIGGLSSLWVLGPRLDSLGSKPVIIFSMFLWLFMLAGWTAAAGKYLHAANGLLILLQFLMGLGSSLTNIANTRLAMGTIPEDKRDHFFAVFSVLSCLSMGLAPIGWGILIDACSGKNAVWLGLEWNKYTIFFSAAAFVLIISMLLARRIHEPKAASMEALLRDIFLHSPQRLWVRIWTRN
ncbi:MAG TPA: MFS transporter [Verrucomicrobiota bacterium]|nr:MFS transporter [Verrucomicrobiota bacterium]